METHRHLWRTLSDTCAEATRLPSGSGLDRWEEDAGQSRPLAQHQLVGKGSQAGERLTPAVSFLPLTLQCCFPSVMGLMRNREAQVTSRLRTCDTVFRMLLSAKLLSGKVNHLCPKSISSVTQVLLFLTNAN